MEGLTHSSELVYDMKADGKTKGLFGTPLFLRYGMGLKSNGVGYDLRALASKDSLILSHKTVAPIDSKTKLTITAQEDTLAWFSDRKKAFDAFKVGFAVEYSV